MMKDLEKNIRFKKKERIAILTLLTLVISFHIFNYLYTPEITPFDQYISLDEVLENTTSLTPVEKDTILKMARAHTKKFQPKRKKKQKRVTLDLKTFNPNTADSISLIKLGLRSYGVSNLIKYRRTGARLNTCEDLKRIYGISERDIERILPYCEIPKPAPRVKRKTYKKKSFQKKSYDESPSKKYAQRQKPNNININEATAEDLQAIRGIGPILSQRIVKFRNSLGGFRSIEQLYDVYGLDREVIDKNLSIINLKYSPSKVSINGEFKSLIRVDGLQRAQVNAILAYRKQHGDFTDLNQLNNLKSLPPELIDRIRPYLKL